jgi:hypothetical protein
MDKNVETPRLKRRDGIAVDEALIKAFRRYFQWVTVA